VLTGHERRALRSLAEVALPQGRVVPAAGEAVVDGVERFLDGVPPAVRTGYRALLAGVELSAALRTGRRLSSLPAGRKLELLDTLHRSEATRLGLRGVMAPLKFVHYESKPVYEALGLRHGVVPPRQRETARWHQQIVDGAGLGGDLELECEAVVVGTGAGGAPVAAELASRGVAVLMLEEGGFYDRADFTGRTVEMMRLLYRQAGTTIAWGNTGIPVPVGRAVGGTTLINSGTCFRPPEKLLATWRALGLSSMTMEGLEPYFARVEEALGVGPSTTQALGKVATVIARGADALGWSHHPLDRNAPGCDGQGLCCFGCPTEAKRSTNVSFVPQALERGAQLITGVKVTRVLTQGETAVGVQGTARLADGRLATVTVRARVVVLACGTLHTPQLLLGQGLANGSGQLGKNLSIHPAAAALALLGEAVDPSRTVPQGYAVDHFVGEGLYYEGATVPLEVQAATIQLFGPAFTHVMEQFNESVMFGFMVKDTSRGRVRPGPGGEPVLSYWLNQADQARLHRGFSLLARLYFAAGAQEVVLPVAGWERLRDLRDVAAFERASLTPRQMDLTAYHPLGTARLGVDAFHSVVDERHEAHDVHNLYVCDGSAVPSSLGVNPQVTIMSLALRAAEGIGRRLERLAPRAA